MATSDPRWHPGAIEDAEAARDWYADRSPFAARGFLLELEVAARAVGEAPLRWPAHRFGTRRRSFSHRYPYALVYRVSPAGVEIVAVAHSGRRPTYWRNR